MGVIWGKGEITMSKKNLFFVAVAALMLSACGGNKPFSQLASAQQEALDFAMNQFDKQKKMNEFPDEVEDSKGNDGNKWQELLDKQNEVAQNCVGTEVEAEATADAGVSIDGNFQVTNVTPGADPTLTLVVKVKMNDESNLPKLAIIGYDDSEPLLPLSSHPFYDHETSSLQFLVRCNSDDPEFPNRLGRITKLVITSDQQLYNQQKSLQRDRKEELMRRYF